MAAPDVMNEFIRLPEAERKNFLRSLSLYLLLRLPDGEHVMLSVEEYQRLTQQARAFLALSRELSQLRQDLREPYPQKTR